ncbi:hypothetical protein QJQ45_000163 [Haematococcus lacustris]|nr:hypothetical protein QJQ45_000163 [Haematococcus lacustris]
MRLPTSLQLFSYQGPSPPVNSNSSINSSNRVRQRLPQQWKRTTSLQTLPLPRPPPPNRAQRSAAAAAAGGPNQAPAGKAPGKTTAPGSCPASPNQVQCSAAAAAAGGPNQAPAGKAPGMTTAPGSRPASPNQVQRSAAATAAAAGPGQTTAKTVAPGRPAGEESMAIS